MRLLIDACVLYPTVMREMLIGVAAAGMFEPRWSARILEEWARATRKLGPEAEVFARGEIAALQARFPMAEVAVDPQAERQFWLPDPDDIHVLAAAVAGSCDAILTVNAKDFPRNILSEEGLWRSAPDELLIGFFDEDAETVRGVAEQVLAEANRLAPETWTIRALMKKARLPKLGKRLV